MDVKALYPSIQWDRGSAEIGRGIKESKIKFEELNPKELVQYIAVTHSRKEIEKAGFSKLVPNKLTGTNLRLAARENDQSHLFDWTDIGVPDNQELKSLLGMAIKKGVHTCLSNHYYTFGGQIRRQSKGGSIGSELTGEVSRLYMLRWDKKYLAKLRRLNIGTMMYIRYVDDTLIVVESIKPGVRYDSKKDILKFHPELVDDDSKIDDDQRTFAVLRSVADRIDKDIQWDEDVASLHSNKKLPCLDLELWMDNNKILFNFYRKPMANKEVISQRSALSHTAKRNTIFQEGMRRILNCHPDLEWSQKAEHLSEFCYSMMISGYTESFRRDIIKGVIDRYNQMMTEVNSGDRELYRSKEKMEDDKKAKGGNSAATWHLSGNYKHVVNIPITPGAQLATRIKDRISNCVAPDGGQTRTLEKGGVSLLNLLSKPDPFKEVGCRWGGDCNLKQNQDCMKSNVIYKIECTACRDKEDDRNEDDRRNEEYQNEDDLREEDVRQLGRRPPRIYIGQTGRSIHSRIQEHISGVRNDKNCPLKKHIDICHGGDNEDAKFETGILHGARTNLSRMILEGEEIQAHQEQGILNSKSEFRGTKIIRLVTDRRVV